MRDKCGVFNERPIVVDPFFSDILHRHPYPAVREPAGLLEAGHGDLAQGTEKGQLVGRHFPVTVEDAFDLVDGASLACILQLEKKCCPGDSLTAQAVWISPFLKSSEADPFEEKLEILRGDIGEKPSLRIAALAVQAFSIDRDRDEYAAVWIQNSFQGKNGIEEMFLRDVHQHGGTDDSIITLIEGGEVIREMPLEHTWCKIRIFLDGKGSEGLAGLQSIGIMAFFDEEAHIPAGTGTNVQDFAFLRKSLGEILFDASRRGIIAVKDFLGVL